MLILRIYYYMYIYVKYTVHVLKIIKITTINFLMVKSSNPLFLTYNPVTGSWATFGVFGCPGDGCCLWLADCGGVDPSCDRFDWVNRLTLIGWLVNLDPCNIILRGVFNWRPHNLYPLGCQHTFNQSLF